MRWVERARRRVGGQFVRRTRPDALLLSTAGTDNHPILLALDEGAVLLIDELDAGLHSRMAAEVIRVFTDPDANPAGVQLIFTSHDATVLSSPSGERLLAPGQVWLTEKDRDGATRLYALTEAEPGAEENLTVSYLEGAFGAVPDLLEGQLARRVTAAREAGQR